jgi:hypothetical protein
MSEPDNTQTIENEKRSGAIGIKRIWILPRSDPPPDEALQSIALQTS